MSRRWKALLSVLALGLLGFAGNWLRVELFFNAEFVFGSVFVMLAVQFFGAAGAVSAGLIASLATILIWGHAWEVPTLTLEALFVALAARRLKNLSIVTLDFFYWISVGAPLVWYFYRDVMNFPLEAAVLVVLKQGVNGVCNALIATLVTLALQFRAGSREKPVFRKVLYASLVSLVLFPSFAMLVFDLRKSFDKSFSSMVSQTQTTSEASRGIMNGWIREQGQRVHAVALTVGNPRRASARHLQQMMEQLLLGAPSFKRMGIFDAAGVSRAYAPLLDELGKPTVGRDLSDRPFFQELKSRKGATLSQVMPSRLGRGAVVVFLAPILSEGAQGRFLGFTSGVASDHVLRSLLKDLAQDPSRHLTLVDSNGNVIASTREDLAPLSQFLNARYSEAELLSGAVYHWLPPQKLGLSNMLRWRDSWLVKGERVGPGMEWLLVTESRLLPLFKVLASEAERKLLAMVVLIVATIIVSAWVSNSLVVTIRELRAATRELPLRLSHGEPVELPQSRISEFAGLIDNFKAANKALRRLFSDQKQHLREKEMMIKDLHDGIGGIVANIAMLGRYGIQQQDPEACKQNLQKIVELATEGSVEIRSFMNSTEIGDSAWTDLAAEIKDYATRILNPKGLEIRVQVKTPPAADSGKSLGSYRYLNVIRIVREALANTLKHSQATQVRIEMGIESGIVKIVIQDDGIGFDPGVVRRRGIANMVQRAQNMGATLSITGTAGTRVELEVPL